MGHPSVPHPFRGSGTVTAGLHDRFLSWVADRVLASVIMFDAALVVPLLVLPMPGSAKLVLGVVSSNWIQWWALPALQRSQVLADAQRRAKADADHEALTHMAMTLARLESIMVDIRTAPGRTDQ